MLNANIHTPHHHHYNHKCPHRFLNNRAGVRGGRCNTTPHWEPVFLLLGEMELTFRKWQKTILIWIWNCAVQVVSTIKDQKRPREANSTEQEMETSHLFQESSPGLTFAVKCFFIDILDFPCFKLITWANTVKHHPRIWQCHLLKILLLFLSSCSGKVFSLHPRYPRRAGKQWASWWRWRWR